MQSDLPALFPRFSPAEFERRHRAIRNAMAREGVEALLVYGTPGGAEVPYLVNYLPASPCWLLFPRMGDPTVLVHFFNHIPCARAQATVDDVRWYGPAPIPTLSTLLEERGWARARIGMVSLNAIPYNQVIELRRRLPELEPVEFGGHMNTLRWVRSEEEITFLRRSGYLTDLACEALEHGLRPDLTEHEIRALIVGAFSGQESDPGIHFLATTSMARPDRFVPWQRPGARTVIRGDVLITELTVSYWNYGTQIHRPFAIGTPPTAVYRELFEVALECYENIRRICRPGTSSEEIVAASAIIEQRGFSTYDSLFHGERGKFPELGSASAIHPREPWTLRENMVHVIQPNPITRDQRAGLQLGAAVLVRPDGGEPLHNYPFKFPVCG